MITIEKGVIRKDGKKIGTAVKDFKFGYHPAVRVRVEVQGGQTLLRVEVRGRRALHWFELDEPDLAAKIVAFAEEVLASKPKPKKDEMYSPNWLRKHGYE